MAALLEIAGLATRLRRPSGDVVAVDGVSLTLERGQALGLVGESGCGKTLLALSAMRLLPAGGEIVRGSVRLEGRELLPLSEREMREVRGRRLAMVFQEPLGSLNPLMTVGKQIAEAVQLHQHVGRAEATARAVAALREVGVPDPERQARSYPHRLSGGMRQRAMIALALGCGADVLIADEPTTALDATVQAQILSLLRQLRRERRMALLFISHDLPVVARVCDEVLVMYAGQVLERGPAAALLESPAHPYTDALRRAIPSPRARAQGEPRPRLAAIPGAPEPGVPRAGCLFAPRCARASPECLAARPALAAVSPGREAACVHPLIPTASQERAS